MQFHSNNHNIQFHVCKTFFQLLQSRAFHRQCQISKQEESWVKTKHYVRNNVEMKSCKKRKKGKRKILSTKDNFRNLLMRFAEAIQSLLKIEMKWGTFLAVFLNILLGWIHLFSVWGFTRKCLFKLRTKRGYKILSQERKMKINFQTYPQRKIDFLTAHFEFAQKIHLRAATVHEVSLKIIA